MTMLIRFTRNADSPWSLRLGLLLAVLTLWWAAPTRADDDAPAAKGQQASAEPADNDNESDDPDPEEAEEEKKGDEPSEKEASGKKEGTAKDDPGEKDKSSDKPDPKAEDDKGESGDAKKATTPQKGPRPTRAADLAAKRRALRERERERAEARRRLTEQRRAGKSGEASEGTERPGAMPKSTTQPAGDDELGEAVGDIDDQEMDPDAEAALLEALANRPAEERTYQFAFEDIDYADLLDAFSRMSGLAVIGDPPTGKVTFKTTEEMDFKTALSRINLLLFKHRENYWMVLEDNILEVSRLTERPRDLDVEDIFPSVAAFEAAERDDNDLVMLIYSPERGSVEALDEIRDFLPDYVRSAPLSDPSKNAMTIFALVKDINKFLDLVELFDEPGKDPRVIKKIVLEHIMPSEAIDSLGQLMDLSGGRAGTRTVKKGGRATVVRSGPSRGISILPDDAQQVLIVRALQSDIDEIERLLPFIDVDTSDDSEFVVIPLKHVNTATMMQGLRPLLRASGETVGAAPKAPKKRRGARGPATAGEVAGANATVVPEPRTNKLIVVGSDEGIERVREIVALLDVESEGDRPTFVRLEYADPAALAAEITPLVHQLRPQAGFTATPDEASNSLALIGTRQAIELAQELIARADVEGATPSPHKIRLEEAKPSDVAAMLSRFDTGAPAKPTPRARPKKGSRPTPRRSTVGGAGKFIADDATGMLYVVCTDIVWEKTYLPRIQEMEEDARRPIEKHIVAVTDADPQTVIDTLNTIVGGETGDAVKMVAVPDGIMLVDATQHEIDEIKELIDVFNFDPEAGFERKVFEIEHAEPSAVRDIVMTMMSSGPVRPQSRIQPKRKGGRPSPRATAPSAAPEIKIVEVGRSLMVYAPAEKMEEIGQLIAEVDVDTAVTDIRIYPFPAGVNVQDVANTLTTLYGGRSVRTQPKRRGKTPTPARPTTVGRVTIIAQPAAHSILVSAPIDEFDRIEETLQKIGTDVTQVDVIYDFIDVQHGSAATIAGLIDPILKNKLNQLMDTGEIPRPAGTGPKSPATQSLLTLQPDPADDRLIIAAPELIVAEARSLVTALDRADSSERVMRTVTLDKADPDEMAQTIQAMLSGQRAAPRRPQQPRQRGKAQPARPASRVGSGAELDVTITTAPGGGALVLMGKVRDVEEVEGWIHELDATATTGEKMVKIFDLGDADVEQVADTLMAVLDSGAVKGPRAPAKPKDDALDFGFFESTITRQGKDLYISADKFAGTMLIAALPAKMREVDELVERITGDPEIVTAMGGGDGEKPFRTYELQYADAFDAVYTLEQIIDAVWAFEDKPSIDYIPFTNILVIKGNPERFGDVEDLIIKYVDKGTARPPVSRAIDSTFGSGMTASNLALLLKARLEATGLNVDVNQINPEEPSSKLEQVHPCLLPPALFGDLGAIAVGQTAPDEPAAEVNEDVDNEQAAIEALLGQALADDPGSGSADSDASSDAPEEEPPPSLTIRVDDKTGTIYLEGSSTAIDDATELIKTIKEDAKDLPAPPDIRIFRLKYVDVNQAAEVLETMFNDRQLRAQQQQMQRAMQQAQRQRQRQQQQEQQKGQDGRRGQQPGQQPGQQQPQAQQQMPQLTVRVYPNPRARTIIIRAATEVFPSIEDLLATIDKKATEPLDYKLFPLEHRVAAEVEEQIKAMFGLGQSRGGARRPQRGGQQRSAQGGGQGIIQMEVPGGGSGALSTQDMSVTSNASTNTVMVMAPAEAMEQVERFINDLEAQDAPEFVTETYKLKHADAAEVLPQLEKMFKRAGGRGGAGSKGGIDPGDVNAPVFMADGRSNAIIVRALEIDLPKIAPLIEQLDVETPIDTVTDYVLVNADATQVAKTLTQLFGKTGGGRRAAAGGSAKAVTIVADAESNVIFATAPPEIQEQIAQRIATIEEEAGEKTKPRVIKVTMGTPSDIAKKIEEALGAKGKRGKPRFQIVGDDVGKQLIVRAPDEVVGDIESLVQILDKPPTGVDIKIYPLEHARAKETLQGLNQMVNQAKGQLARSNVHMDLFSATADERSNALVVMGGPMTFMLIEKILKDLDVPPRDPTQVVTKMYQLVNAKAADLARNINNIYRGRKEKGVEPPKAEANASSNTLLVRGTKAQIEEIDRDIIGPAEEAVVTATDELRDERIPLTYAKADEVAQVLTQRFNDKFRAIKLAGIKNIKPAELTVSITPEVNSNALLVTASEANLAYITAILPSIDLEDIGTKTATTTKIYPLTYADPNNVANVINSAYRKQGKVAQKDRVQAVVEWGTQSVVVIASAENQEKITELVGELDVDTGSGQVRQVYKLKEARASDVAAIIDRTLRGSRRTNRRGQLPVSVVANDALNSLVISGTQKDYDAILPLIEELDRKPEEMTGLVVRVYQLKYADPGSTMGTINSAFPRLRGQTPEDTVRAAYAHGTAALVVSASVENQEKVEDLLAQIDIESTSERSVHLVALEHANADDLARNLGQLFGRTKRRQRDEQPISFTSEPGSNTLMVYANELELEEILPLLKSLDVKPEFEKDRIFKSFKLTYAESWGVRRMIDDSFRLPGRNRNPRDIVTSMEDWGSNSIVVTASPEKMEQVEKLIAEVDRQGAGQRQVHVVTIEHADPEAVNQALGQIFVQGGRGRRGPTVSISNPRGSDTLLIKANETEFAEIQQVIVDLDKSEAEIGGEIEVIQLKHTNAGETLEILQEYLRKPGGRGGRGGRGGELVGDIRLSAAESINAIVVSGDRDEIDHLVEIVATIDVEMEDDQAAPKIIRLQHAQASELEQSLTTVFAEQRGGRRGGRRGGAATMVPIIVGNDATNTLIVRASAVDYRRIEELVAEMDTEEAGAGADMKILTLQPGVNATEMAELIDGLLEEQAQNQRSSGGRRRSSPVQRVFVRADVRTNSLILSGPQSKFDEVEALVEELANIGPRGGTVSMVIPIKNADPAEIKQLIDQVVSESQSGGSSSRRGGRRRR